LHHLAALRASHLNITTHCGCGGTAAACITPASIPLLRSAYRRWTSTETILNNAKAAANST